MKIKPILYAAFIGITLIFSGYSAQADESESAMEKSINTLLGYWSGEKKSFKTDYNATHVLSPYTGIRGRYEIIKRNMSIGLVENIIGESVFISGPHNNSINYSSYNDFGRYNPSFLNKLYDNLFNLTNNEAFVRSFQGWYDTELKQYLRLYFLSFPEAAYDRNIMSQYLQVMKKNSKNYGESGVSFLTSQFRSFVKDANKHGYGFAEAYAVPGFWVRRSIDGTAHQFWKLLKLVLLTFDKDFVEKHEFIGINAVALCLQKVQFPSEMEACSGVDYATVDSELNRVYGLLRKTLKNDNDFMSHLKSSQRAWIKLKESDIKIYQSNSLVQPSISNRKIDYKTKITIERLATLNNWLRNVKYHGNSGDSTSQDTGQYKIINWKNRTNTELKKEINSIFKTETFKKESISAITPKNLGKTKKVETIYSKPWGKKYQVVGVFITDPQNLSRKPEGFYIGVFNETIELVASSANLMETLKGFNHFDSNQDNYYAAVYGKDIEGFDIRDDSVAMAIQYGSSLSFVGGGTDIQNLVLLELQGEKVVPIFDEVIRAYTQYKGGPATRDIHNTLIIQKVKKDGYFNLVVKTTNTQLKTAYQWNSETGQYN